ncbi:MAG TPA: hypothetical protein VGO09_05260 [Flavisolibacter sp.]|jgi:hypothetical protein|nr:hypothetical protein [Flavisolibacter sp.]
MKKIMFLLVLLSCIINSFCQVTQPLVKDKNFYFQKSKNQKTVAWVLLSGGVVAMVVSAAISVSDMSFSLSNTYTPPQSNGGEIVAVIGLAAALASIPVFISAAKNRRRSASVSFTNQKIWIEKLNGFAFTSQPTITLKVRLIKR